MCSTEHKDLARAARSVSEGHASNSYLTPLQFLGGFAIIVTG